MRILFALDKYRSQAGGADRSARALVSAFAAAGHEVRVLEAGAAETETVLDGIAVSTRPLRSARWIADGDYRGCRWNIEWEPIVARVIHEFDPHWLLTQNMLAPASVSAARKAGVRSAIFFRGYRCLSPDFFAGREALEAEPLSFGNAPWRSKLKWPLVVNLMNLHTAAYRAATTVVANSEYVRRVIQRFFNRDAAVLYPTLDLPPASPSSPPDPAGPLLFVKPQPIKGVGTVVELARRMPGRRFVVAGRASRCVTRQLTGIGNIEHRGWVEDMDALYRSSSLLLGPARIPEPFGRVFVEAGLCGVPSVAAGAGGIPEAVGQGGALVPFGADAGDWERAIEDALIPERHALLAERAHAHAAALLAEHNAARLLRILDLA